jgi:replicative DNA helicase
MRDSSTNLQVLGGIMLHPQYLSEIDKYSLNITDFSTKLEKYVFSAIYGLYQNGAIKITPVDVENYLSTNDVAADTFKKENGIEYLQDMMEIAQPDNFQYYYDRLKKFNLLNDLKKAGFDTSDFYVEDIFDVDSFAVNRKFEDLKPQDIIAELRKKLIHLENKYEAGEEVEVESITDGLDEFFEGLQSREDMGISLQGEIFTEIIGGARKGTLTIRSAASSVGKSRNAVGDSCFLAFPIRYDQEVQRWVKQGHNEKVIYIVTEQSFSEIRKMVLAYLTGINESKLKYWDLTQKEETLVLQARQIMEIFKDNLTLIKMPNPTIELVKTQIRESCLVTGAEYVFFDYIFISPSLLKEFKGFNLRNDEVLLMFATALKDLAVELGVCMMTSTQVNAHADDSTNIRNESSLAGGRATINKADYGCIMARPSKEELEVLAAGGFVDEPNLVTDMFKVRDGAWTQVRIWSSMDLGTLRKKDLFLTDSRMEPIKGFELQRTFDVEIWDEDEKDGITKLVEELNSGVVNAKL